MSSLPRQEHTRIAKEKQEGISFQKYREIIVDDFSKKDIRADEYCKETIALTLGVLRERPLNFSIYRVPSKLRKINEDAYNPHMVSIGPFHHRREDLLKMEEYKWRYMQGLLTRTSNEEDTLNECVNAINKLQHNVPGCYAEDLNMTWKKLMEILVVDGCFILELFIKYSEENNDDEIINSAWMIPTIKHDLALLENQIPFFVLKKLFKIIEKSLRRQHSLTEYALHFFLSDSNSKKVKKVLKNVSLKKARHLLEILHIFYLPTSLEINPQVHDSWGFKHCATKLVEAGIGIEKAGGGAATSSDLLEITFSAGVIKLPALRIDETTETIFRNLIAFEQCSVGITHHITSYAMLIKNLILSTQDVELLEAKQIIEKSASSSEDVSTFFNRMGREVVLKEFCFAKLCKEVDAYSKSWLHCRRIKAYSGVRWRRYMNSLRNDYFSSPWTIISFIAAVMLLILTLLQTIYTMLSY